eukprot:1328368-Amorphochlora_amoeboformis.AAC.1
MGKKGSLGRVRGKERKKKRGKKERKREGKSGKEQGERRRERERGTRRLALREPVGLQGFTIVTIFTGLPAANFCIRD